MPNKPKRKEKKTTYFWLSDDWCRSKILEASTSPYSLENQCTCKHVRRDIITLWMRAMRAIARTRSRHKTIPELAVFNAVLQDRGFSDRLRQRQFGCWIIVDDYAREVEKSKTTSRGRVREKKKGDLCDGCVRSISQSGYASIQPELTQWVSSRCDREFAIQSCFYLGWTYPQRSMIGVDFYLAWGSHAVRTNRRAIYIGC